MLCIGRLPLEWKRVEWELWVLLMEYVILSIVPVRVTCLVTGGLNDWFWWPNNLLMLWQVFDSLSSHKVCFVCCWQVHFVRVNNLCFLLKIECLLVILNLSLCQLPMIVLSIVREKSLWVWISHESIGTSSHSSSGITCRQVLNCINKIQKLGHANSWVKTEFQFRFSSPKPNLPSYTYMVMHSKYLVLLKHLLPNTVQTSLEIHASPVFASSWRTRRCQLV